MTHSFCASRDLMLSSAFFVFHSISHSFSIQTTLLCTAIFPEVKHRSNVCIRKSIQHMSYEVSNLNSSSVPLYGFISFLFSASPWWLCVCMSVSLCPQTASSAGVCYTVFILSLAPPKLSNADLILNLLHFCLPSIRQLKITRFFFLTLRWSYIVLNNLCEVKQPVLHCNPEGHALLREERMR